ncbi:MAG: T9SS type A sorting domain-containing protein [Bacteroidetes bacterium]|nr:T9SS type A sorting domain-containing protein [Bacteroidota bacterium]
MKKNILITLLLLLSFYTNSQTTFNKLFSFYGNNPYTSITATSIVAKGSDYIISGTLFDTINNNYQTLYFYKLDSIGNIVKITSFTRNGYNYYSNISSLIELKNGGYCFIGEMDTANNNPIHFVIRFDQNMDTLWTKIILYDTIWEALRKVRETSDKGFIFVGEREISLDNLGVLLVKTDSMGNQLWKKIIPFSNLSGVGNVLETSDKGFLIKGYTGSTAQGDGNPFLMKTDSAGNVIWAKIIGGNEYDGGGGMAITMQGDYLFAYGYSTYTYPFNEDWSARLNIIKYAPDGSVIWNRMYDTIRNYLGVCKIQVLPNNDFIVMGNHSLKDSANFFPSFLFKFNANGDSLWRKIYYVADKFGDRNLLADNVLNADGSITACGWVDGDTLVPYEQIWLLKTDSMGYAPGPQNVGIIDLPYLYVGYGELKVYPNPFTEKIYVSNSTNVGNYELTDALGRVVWEGKQIENHNFSDLKLGLYILKVKLKNSIQSLMLIKH